ncbi:MAG TPA: DUF4167 domain-containing protein [Magnetospirillaceae bacterium]|jgi:hypothetical protein
MKPGQNSKLRMRGRMNNGGGGGGKRHMPMRTNQTYDSNGPDIRVRGNAHQVLEKYLALARDASSQGDRIAAENFYQHAEHYFRTINSQNQHQNQNNQQRFQNNNRQQTPADDHALLSGDVQGEETDGETDNGEGEEEAQDGQSAPLNA